MSVKRKVVVLTAICWIFAVGIPVVLLRALFVGSITRFGTTFTFEHPVFWLHIVLGGFGTAVLIWICILSTRSLLEKRPF